MGIEYTVEHAAACVACLPMGSASVARRFPDYAMLLRDLPLKVLADALTGSARNGDITDQVEPLPRDEFIKWLGSRFLEDGDTDVIR